MFGRLTHKYQMDSVARPPFRWAYVEAAIFAVRYNAKAHGFYQSKKAKTNGIVAIKALSNKIARASYYIMRDQVPFDEGMLFK